MQRLLKGKRLLEGGAYFNVNTPVDAALIRGRWLFETRHLIEEIREGVYVTIFFPSFIVFPILKIYI